MGTEAIGNVLVGDKLVELAELVNAKGKATDLKEVFKESRTDQSNAFPSGMEYVALPRSTLPSTILEFSVALRSSPW